jgi:phosphate starvation-inducible PhoH-like protein
MTDKATRRQNIRAKRAADREHKVQALNPAKAPLVAMNDHQKALLSALRRDRQIFAVGLAGTGKTFLASAVASDMLLDEKISKIVLCRPAVGVEEDLGFLPGTMDNKMEPWVAPFMDVFKERLGLIALKSRLESGAIEIVPISFMRGRTFKNSFVIIDEAQNCTLSQLKMILTRIGENCIVVVTGDPTQTDIGYRSGLQTVINMIPLNDIPATVVQFTAEDVVRSDTCREWTEAFDRREKGLLDGPALRIA